MGLEWYTFGAIMFGGLLFLLLLGIPVGFSLLITAMASSLMLGQGLMFWVDIPGYFFHHLNSFTMTCVPIFILMALFAQHARFGEDLFRSMGIWLRKIPGSLNIVAVATCAIFSAISGTSVATAAAVGLVAMPIFQKFGYDKKLSVGTLAGGGALGILIPPSVPMIMYAIITNQSIGHMFAGGILPGIMTAGIFMAYIAIRCKLNPQLAPVIPRSAMGDISTFKAILNVGPLMGIILLVLLVIYFGIATPTEAAAIGTVGMAVLALLYKRMNLKGIFKASADGMRIGAFIILIFLAALAFGHVAVRGGVAAGLSNYVISLGLSKYAVLFMILGILLLLGCFMDPVPIILTTMPILFPLATSVGWDPVYFGVVCTMMLETAAITPPVGINLFILNGIGKGHVSMTEIIRGALPYNLLYFAAIVFVVIFPDIVMLLPNLMRG
ncbi:MAG: TRAP transporter large permease subunit [Deltaproteobacteria bacterium]